VLSRRLFSALLALFAAGALALAGCGDEDETASSALDEALGYLSEDAGFVFIAATDTDDYDDFEKVADKFPFAGQIEDSLKESLEQGDVDYDDDVKPLLGNELVIGTDDNASFLDSSSDTPFVLALETEDAGKLEDFAESGGGEKTGESEGYDLYEGEDDDTFLAVKDEILVLSNDEDALANALKQRGEDDRLTEDDVEPAFEDLPEDAPMKAYVNVKALLAASPDAKDALKVEWVDHIETFGLSADAEEDSVALDWSVRTDPEGLTDEDLPIATGSEAPQLLERDEGSAEIVLSVRDPSQILDFTLATLKVVDPAGFAEYESGKKEIGRQLGIDVDKDVLDQLTGDVATAITIDGDFGVRATLADADAFEGTLAKIMDKLPEFSSGTTVTKPKQGDRFYGVATADGGSYAVGIAQDALVIANTADLASQVATRPLVDAEGQEGSFVMAADAEQLANALLGSLVGGLEGLGGTLVTGPLGDLLQSVSASTEGLTGRLELTID
jgi:hypothetical protein